MLQRTFVLETKWLVQEIENFVLFFYKILDRGINGYKCYLILNDITLGESSATYVCYQTSFIKTIFLVKFGQSVND